MKKTRTIVAMLLLVFALSFSALAKDGVVTVMGVWGDQELEAFTKVMQEFTKRTGI